MYLDKKELSTITGGAVTATFLNAISRIITTFYNIGVHIGSTIRRVSNGTVCR